MCCLARNMHVSQHNMEDHLREMGQMGKCGLRKNNKKTQVQVKAIVLKMNMFGS